MPSTIQKSSEEPSWSLMRLVTPTGTTKNRPIARTSATTTVPNHIPPEMSCSSSGSWALAEMPSALKPITIDSTSATTPRTIGRRSARWRFMTDVSGDETTSISPRAASSGSSPSPSSCSGSGLRTATAQVETPRIITPSSTAWPPTGASRWAQRRPGASPGASLWTTSAAGGAPDAGGGAGGAPGGRRARPAPAPPPPSGLRGARALGSAPLEALDAAAGVHELLPARVERVAVRADLDVDLGLGRAGRELVAARAPHVGLDVFGVDSGLHRFTQCSVENAPRTGCRIRARGRLTRHGVRARRPDRGRLPAAQRARRRRPERLLLHVPARLLRGHLAPAAPRRARRPGGVLDPQLARHAAAAARARDAPPALARGLLHG